MMRLMGKRQLSELQPFEFAITLIIADLIATPMSDNSMPLAYGLIPIFTLFIMHLLINKISARNIHFRKLINGKPMIVITPNGIDTRALFRLDMNVDDLMDSLRSSGYFNPSDVKYAILETNGKLSILPNGYKRPATPEDLNITVKEVTLPKILITEGKIIDNCMVSENLTTNNIEAILADFQLQPKDVYIMVVSDESQYFIQPFKGKAIRATIINKKCA